MNTSEAYATAHRIYLFYGIISLFHFGISFLNVKNTRTKEVMIYVYLFLLIFFGISMLMTDSSNSSVCFIIPIVVFPLVLVAKPHVLGSIVFFGVITAIIASGATQDPSVHMSNLLDIIPCGIMSILMIFVIMRNRMQRFYYRVEKRQFQETAKEAEREVENIEDFLNMLVHSSSEEHDLDKALQKLVTEIGKKLNTDRVYILEQNETGTFDNNYEWCREGVRSGKERMKNIPYGGVIEVWYKLFDKSSCVVIDDVEEYKATNKIVYDTLKAENISSLILHSLTVDGERVGYFGVDNPPQETHKYIVSLLNATEFFITAIIRVRNNMRILEDRATYDTLTHCKNRATMSWLLNEEFDKNEPLALLTFDCNGLKTVNDTCGHEAGDALLIRIAGILRSIFGNNNTYRVGGDEFIAAISGISRSAFESLVKQSEEKIGDLASFGCVYKEKVDIDITALLKVADDIMYQQKKRFYEKNHSLSVNSDKEK